MPSPYNPEPFDVLLFDPAEVSPASVVINLPQAPFNGAHVTLSAQTFDNTEVTINAQGGDLLYSPLFSGAAATVNRRMPGVSIMLMYHAASATWIGHSEYTPDINRYVSLYEVASTPVAIGTTPTRLALTGVIGDLDGLWTVDGNGDLVANGDFQDSKSIEADVLFDMTATANNQETTLRLEFVLTGTGTLLEIPDVFPFQTSRTGTFETVLQTRGSIKAVAGDILSLQATRAVADTMTANATSGIVSA